MKSILEWYKMLPPDIQEEAVFMAKNQEREARRVISLAEAVGALHWAWAKDIAKTLNRPKVEWADVQLKAALGEYNTPFYSKYLKPVGAEVKTLT